MVEISDEAVEAALGAYFKGIGFAWKKLGSVEAKGNHDAMRAALAAAIPMLGVGAWQPIETAPKDGTAIWVCNDLYDRNGFLPASVRWRTYHPNLQGGATWRDINGHKVEGPQYWQPLPAPPVPVGIIEETGHEG
jgi:hypothetical protein